MLGVVKFYKANYLSICNNLESQSIPFKIIEGDNEGDFELCKGFILPGVGNAQNCLRNIRATKNGKKLLKKIDKGNTHLLGICVGAQILLSNSYETKNRKGLDLISGSTEPLHINEKIEVGFKKIVKIDHPLFENISSSEFFYFCHGYIPNIVDKEVTISHTVCKKKYPAFFCKEKIFGVQFHPERSGEPGKKFLHNFSNLVQGIAQ